MTLILASYLTVATTASNFFIRPLGPNMEGDNTKYTKHLSGNKNYNLARVKKGRKE